ncbi:hypothetical protein QR680_000144 [Steinernema hermaphroditum]|uniref:SH3 domain-containing protein n=1 Tax=Steinernema hermaphroditum TaxID=289476 RepID=A0AA39GTK4_9BILA|nr:hypothetical protein QR680_000144 [Steinernema hermaphroditum]
MYADDVDEDSDFTESTTSKSQRTSKVSAVSETRSVPREAAVVSTTALQSRVQPQAQPRALPRHRSPSQTKSSPTITTTSKSDDGVVVKGNLFIALVHRKAINKGDLNVQKGDVLKIHSTREDGWWIAENENGQRGMVPKNILKHCTGDVVKPQRAVQRIQAEVHRSAAHPSRQPPARRRAIHANFHNTLECHMALRLSESNWSFHDLFWNDRLHTIQKRHVTTCKMFKVDKITKYNIGSAEPTGHYLRMCLFDKSAVTGRQVVSNFHYVFPAAIKNNTWVFEKNVKLFRPQYNSQFFARSNYRMDKVILMIELFVTLRKPGSPLSHARSFFAELPLLNEAHQSLLKNGTRQIQMEASNAAFKDTPTITLSISDISQKQVGFCDMLPDVVVWNPSYLQLTAAYRVCLGHFTRTRADPTSADATFDPLLGLFPRLCDQPDMLDLLMALCVKKKLNFNMMNDAFVEQFSNLFVTSVFGIDQLASLPKYDLWDEPSLKRREEMLTTFLTTLLISNQNPLKYQTEMKIRPLDIHKFAVDLCGPHAID